MNIYGIPVELGLGVGVEELFAFSSPCMHSGPNSLVCSFNSGNRSIKQTLLQNPVRESKGKTADKYLSPTTRGVRERNHRMDGYPSLPTHVGNYVTTGTHPSGSYVLTYLTYLLIYRRDR